MKLVLSVAAIVLVASLPAQAQQRPYPEGKRPESRAVGGPYKILYRAVGVSDSAHAADVGTATTFHCHNFSNVDERLIFRVTNYDGVVITNVAVTIEPNKMITTSTHGTLAFFEDFYLSPGTHIQQGSVVIFGTSINMMCSAMIVDAAARGSGIALNMMRYNPVPKTME